MSKLTDIKNRIDQLDGGAFQNLCDSYLAYRGYGSGYSLGMNTGTDKTAKGSPDTYFLTADKRYVFVMYTTQKTDFLKKAIEDIDKCFDAKRTGVSADNIAEIIYCHTYGRLTPGDDQYLRKYCEQYGAVLTLIGLDELGNGIFRDFPILAKDFLGINVDSGQIFPLNVFVERHDANKMSAPLGTEFLFRNDELAKAKEVLNINDVLLIAGPAGVGKTRFALELCQQLAEEQNYTVLVIKSNNLRLYEDLISAIEEDKKYLVLIDDANELSELHLVLDYLHPMAKSRHISKIIMTVRDYARKQIIDKTLEFTKPETIKITAFKDDEIRKLIETCYGITNPLYTDRIIAIAEGNARLAMLAGKLAVESNNLTSIQDASDLYHSYYQNQLADLISSQTGIYTAGIISFVQSIHLDSLDSLRSVFDIAGITEDNFKSDIKLLHEAEIVDLCNDKAARISDQSFSNFLIKYVFVEEKIIPLSTMIETCFYISKSRAVDACNVLLNVFSDQAVRDYVEAQINIVWDKIENDAELFEPFLKAFHMVRPTQTLVLMQERIEYEQYNSFDVRAAMLEKDRPNRSISDDIIQILSSFKNHNELPTAVELLLLYYKKRPDLYEQFYSALAEGFGFDNNSQRFGYYTQNAVIDHLCAAIDAAPDDTNLLSLFVRVAGYFLKLDYSTYADGRHNSILIYTVLLQPDKPVLEYRQKLLLKLHQIYRRGNMHAEIEHLLEDYCTPSYESNVNWEVIRAEFKEVLNFFSLFQNENLYHSVIAQKIEQVAKRINYDASDVLSLFLASNKYKIYSTLAQNHHEDFFLEYEQGVQKHKEQVRKLVEKYTPQDIDYLIQVCVESVCSFDKTESELGQGLGYVFEALQSRKRLLLHLVEAYMKADTPYEIYIGEALSKMFEFMSASEVKQFITRYNYRQQNVWLWQFYTLIPENQISTQWAEDLLHYLDSPDTNLKSSPYRSLNSLHKYESVEPRIIFKALRIIAMHYKESPSIFNLYAFDILNHRRPEDAKETFKMFSDDLPLLEDIYLKGISCSDHNDYAGVLLFNIISADTSFLNRYLDHLIETTDTFIFNKYKDIERLLRLWDTDCFMDFGDMVFEYLHEKRKPYYQLASPLSKILVNRSNRQEIISKQDLWIAHVIEQHSADEDRMKELFFAIVELPCERCKKAVEKFLALNSDPDAFSQLSLEPSSWGGSGSLIPYMQKRIDYLTSLLPSMTGVKYLKHRQRIQRDIEAWKARIYNEEIRELLDNWYY